MNLHTCRNCEIAVTESGQIPIGNKNMRGKEYQLKKKYYIKKEVYPECQGNGVMLENLDKVNRKD